MNSDEHILCGRHAAAPSLPTAGLDERETRRLREARCGLCRAVKSRYGQVPRIAATDHLALYVLLCDSLEEAFERRGAGPCIAHPLTREAYVSSRFTDYAADLSVALAYHVAIGRCGRGLRMRAVEASLARAYARAMTNIPEECDSMQTTYARVRRIERGGGEGLDAVADEVASLFGELFVWGQDVWRPQMRELGESLGRLACYAGLAASPRDDARAPRRDTPLCSGLSPEDAHSLLDRLADDARRVLDKLPLERDRHLLRAALGEGL